MKNKLLLLAAILCISGGCCANANLSLSDLTTPKSAAYRVGISDIPENPYIQAQDLQNSIEETIRKQTQNTTNENRELSYSELSIKNLSKEIAYDLECEEQDMVSDLSLLWQGAAMQSDTINFALYKLANPDADKPDKSAVKNMLKTVASMSTLVGAGISNPLLAGSSLIGANVLGIMGQDTKALNYKYSKVTDADMIILIRKVEDLQQKTVNLYYDYMSAKKQLEMTTNLAQLRKERFELAQQNNAPREIIVITDSHFRTAIDKQKTARAEFLSKRAALEQFVGNEAFTQFEKELALRENNQKNSDSNINEEYQQTINNVENYTDCLNESKTASLSGVGYVEEDKNLSKLPPLEPTPLTQEQKIEQQLEAQEEKLSQEVDELANEKVKGKKTKKQKVKEEKPKKVKKDPYDTKGLIFLHDKQPDKSNYETNVSVDDVKSEVETKQKQKQKQKKTKGKINQTQEQPTQQPQQAENKQEPPHYNPVDYYTPKKPMQKFNGVELLPLDEIKAPDLKPNGYSIFAK